LGSRLAVVKVQLPASPLQELFGGGFIPPSQEREDGGLMPMALLQGMGDGQSQFGGFAFRCQKYQEYNLALPGSEPLFSDADVGSCFSDLGPADWHGGHFLTCYRALAVLSGFQSLLGGEQQFSIIGVGCISIGQAGFQAGQSLFK
jgi:hypothetical protein